MIAGQATKLSRTMHDIRYDAVKDEFVVGNPFAQAILMFPGGIDGDQAPSRMIIGPKTRLQTPDNLEIDSVNRELYVPEAEGVLVFPLDEQGNVAPKRILRGANWAASAVAADPIHNVIVVNGSYGKGLTREALMVFNRTEQGVAEPKGVIQGPKTGLKAVRQILVYPPKGWVVISQLTAGDIAEPEGTFVGVWSINDKGDVPPRWMIPGNAGTVMKKPRGVVLNPRHKELIVSDMRLNAVLTFSFPELF